MMRMYIAEFKVLGLPALWSWSGACAALALAAIVARLVVAVRRRERAPVDGWHVGLIVLFAALGMRSLRFLPYLTLVSAPAVGAARRRGGAALQAVRARTALAAARS